MRDSTHPAAYFPSALQVLGQVTWSFQSQLLHPWIRNNNNNYLTEFLWELNPTVNAKWPLYDTHSTYQLWLPTLKKKFREYHKWQKSVPELPVFARSLWPQPSAEQFWMSAPACSAGHYCLLLCTSVPEGSWSRLAALQGACCSCRQSPEGSCLGPALPDQGGLSPLSMNMQSSGVPSCFLAVYS